MSSFQGRGTKLERFLPKNQHTQRKLFKFENWCSGDMVSKGYKFDFQSQISISKIIRIFLIFFSFNNANVGAHFLLLTLLDNIDF